MIGWLLLPLLALAGPGMEQQGFVDSLPKEFSYIENNTYATGDMHLILQVGGGREEVTYLLLMEFVQLGSLEKQQAHLKLMIESLNALARCFAGEDTKAARRVAMQLYHWRDQILRDHGPELEESAEGIYSNPMRFNGALIRGHLFVEEGRIMGRYIVGPDPASLGK